MFDGDSSLIELDVSKFETPNLNKMNGMFNGCASLKTVTIGI